MKKLLSAVLTLAMLVAAAPVALAAPAPGEMLVKDDDDYYIESAEPVAPGSTFWVYLEDAYDDDEKSVKEPKNIKMDKNVTVTDSDTGKDVKMLSVDKSPDRLRYDSGSKDRGYYARVTVKSVSSSSYPEAGYDVEDFVLTYTSYAEDSKGETVELPALDFRIEYDEADDEFEDDAKMFAFDKDDDVEIDLPDNAGIFTGTARRDFEIIAAMNTKVDSSLLNKYPNGDIRFFNGNGANFPVTGGKLTIYADSGDYLYEVSGSTLTDRSSTWSSSKNAFVISTTTIGKYIVSDTKLSARTETGATGTTSSSTPAASSQSEYIGSTPLPANPVITNPQTGACA